MNVDVTDKQALRALAESERRVTRRVEVIDLCDALIHFISVPNLETRAAMAEVSCPVCAKRRRRDTQRQQKWPSGKINISGN